MNNHFNYYNALNRNFFREDLYNAENNFSLNNNVNNSNSLNNILYGPYEGFIKGNLFKNLYQQYKNYQPAIITPRNEQEQTLFNLDQIQFAMHELNLYLDNYPNDRDMFNQFVMLRNSYNKLLMEYENKYDAINVNSISLNNVPFGWVEQTWPWDRGNM